MWDPHLKTINQTCPEPVLQHIESFSDRTGSNCRGTGDAVANHDGSDLNYNDALKPTVLTPPQPNIGSACNLT